MTVAGFAHLLFHQRSSGSSFFDQLPVSPHSVPHSRTPTQFYRPSIHPTPYPPKYITQHLSRQTPPSQSSPLHVRSPERRGTVPRVRHASRVLRVRRQIRSLQTLAKREPPRSLPGPRQLRGDRGNGRSHLECHQCARDDYR